VNLKFTFIVFNPTAGPYTSNMKVNVKFNAPPEGAYALRRAGALLAIYAAASMAGLLLSAVTHRF